MHKKPSGFCMSVYTKEITILFFNKVSSSRVQLALGQHSTALIQYSDERSYNRLGGK